MDTTASVRSCMEDIVKYTIHSVASCSFVAPGCRAHVLPRSLLTPKLTIFGIWLGFFIREVLCTLHVGVQETFELVWRYAVINLNDSSWFSAVITLNWMVDSGRVMVKVNPFCDRRDERFNKPRIVLPSYTITVHQLSYNSVKSLTWGRRFYAAQWVRDRAK